jgi:hypothetical protein
VGGGLQHVHVLRRRQGPQFPARNHRLELDGEFSEFEKRLVAFLWSQGMQNFTISLVTDYSRDHPEGKRFVYVEGLDLLSEGKRRRVIQSVHWKERRLWRRLREMGIE